MVNQVSNKISNSEYDDLISNSLKNNNIKEKSIVSGKIISIENDIVTIDVGLKSEGRVPLNEFSRPGQKPEVNIGDETEVFIDNVDNANGETSLSREKAVKQKAWHDLQECFNNNSTVTGIPFNRVKGGMSVDLNGVTAFLPGSQIDTRQVIKDTKELLNKPIELMILKMDKYRGNIVVSRKAITENELKEQRKELLSKIDEGSIIEGKVKNLTDYGAFIDLGGLDGLVHVTDISWTKINNPSDILELNQSIKVKVLKFDQELSRLSLGIKQLSDNPWDQVHDNIKVDDVISSKITNIGDNHINLIINELYDGSISLGELTWLKKPAHPSKIVNLDDIIEVKVLDIDDERKKINCSLKQMRENPWMKLNENYKINDSFETEIVNIVDFGIFVKVQDEIDGMVHVSDLSYDEKECESMLQKFKKNDKVNVKILDINVDKERISLGIKQLSNDPVQDFLDKNPINSKITGKITEVDDKMLKVELDSANKIYGFIKKVNLSKDKSEQKTDRYAVGENVDSVVISLDNKLRVLNLSIKKLEIQDEKEALSKYGSSASGASLGDILGSVLKK
ncbi:MAG: 30S ribosomal protein S1 [Alphaproteobacteria bacterium]